jgi:hypothetical protein
MATAPKASELCASAARFAQSTLEAHHKGDHQRVALDAGTALEHLTKACLVMRSPALLSELKPGPNNWQSLLLLCGFAEGRPNQLRTVGLREARERLKTFVSSAASEADLALLINLRDGVVHAAVDEEVEERLLVAFVQQADACLVDMSRSRYDFWAERVDVVDALLANASDKVTHRVQVKLAAARAAFVEKYGEVLEELFQLIRKMPPQFDQMQEAVAECPVCGSQGVAGGEMSVDVAGDHEDDVWAWVHFDPTGFSCPMCGLRLDTQAEVVAAGIPAGWDLPDLDPYGFMPRDSADYDG